MKTLRTIVMLLLAVLLCSCSIDPPLHLRKAVEIEVEVDTKVDIDVMWQINWEAEWEYVWNVETLGPLGYVQPTGMRLHAYTLGPDGEYVAYQVHNFSGEESRVRMFAGLYNFLFHNNDSESILFSAEDEYADVYAYTRMISKGLRASSLVKSSRQKGNSTTPATKAEENGGESQQFNDDPVVLMPDCLYSLFDQGQEVSDNLEDYEYVNGRYIYRIKGNLHPSTFIYLVQVRLLNNNGRVVGSAGGAALTGMSEGVNLQTGITSTNVVSVPMDVRVNRAADPDLLGARLLSFGIPGCDPYDKASVAATTSQHFLVLSVAYNDGGYNNIHVDVTDQVRALPLGGVITLELDVNDFPPPEPPTPVGGGFNALLGEWKEETGSHTIVY